MYAIIQVPTRHIDKLLEGTYWRRKTLIDTCA